MPEFVKYNHKPVPGEIELLEQVFAQGYLHVSNFKEWIKHDPKSVTLGFADVVFAFPISLNVTQADGSMGPRVTIIAPILIKGIVVKALKDGNPYLGFPQVKEKLTAEEEAAKRARGEKIEYFDVVCPMSGETRTAATRVMFARGDIQLAIQHSIEMGNRSPASAPAGVPVGQTTSVPVGQAAGAVDLPTSVPADIEIPAAGEASPFAADEDAVGAQAAGLAGGGSIPL